MSWGAAGAGASEGLESVLARELLEQKFKQSQLEHTDEVALKSRQLDQTGNDQKSEAELRAAQTAGILRSQKEDDARTQQEDQLLNDPTTPDPIKQFLHLRRVTPKGENVPYQLITEPTGPPHTTPAITTGSFMLDGKPVVGQKTHDGRVMVGGVDVTDKVTPFSPPSNSPDAVAQNDNGFFLLNRKNATARPVTVAGGGDQLPVKSPAQVVQRQDMATRVGSHFDDLSKELDEAEKQGLLGPLSGRTVSDFLGSGVGSTGDPAKDELLGNLRMDLSGVVTGFGSLHGRGGANAGIAQKLAADAFNAKKMSHAELKGGIDSLKKWVDAYAAPTAAHGAAAPAADATAPKERTYNPATGKLE